MTKEITYGFSDIENFDITVEHKGDIVVFSIAGLDGAFVAEMTHLEFADFVKELKIDYA